MDAALKTLVNALVSNILNPVLALMFAIATLVFVYGIVEFLLGMSANIGDGKERGKKHMLYGILGMFIMASAYGILKLISNTVCGFSGGVACPSI